MQNRGEGTSGRFAEYTGNEFPVLRGREKHGCCVLTVSFT